MNWQEFGEISVLSRSVIMMWKIIWFFRESEEVEQMSSPLIILSENMIRMGGKVETKSTTVLGNTTKREN